MLLSETFSVTALFFIEFIRFLMLRSFQTGADCDRADGEGRAENNLLGLQGLCADQGREEPGDKEQNVKLLFTLTLYESYSSLLYT